MAVDKFTIKHEFLEQIIRVKEEMFFRTGKISRPKLGTSIGHSVYPPNFNLHLTFWPIKVLTN